MLAKNCGDDIRQRSTLLEKHHSVRVKLRREGLIRQLVEMGSCLGHEGQEMSLVGDGRQTIVLICGASLLACLENIW
jgi:hypothetical protein